jgi:TrpR family trp operon transcriptional repressor
MGSNDRRPLRELSRILSRIRDPALIDRFLQSMLTPREVRDLAGRWELVKRLNEGASQRSIARGLHMSLCKITRGSRELKKPRSPLRTVLERHLQGPPRADLKSSKQEKLW